MVAQLQPREERVDIPHASPSDTHANPRAKAAKKKRGATKRHPGLAGWMTRAVAILGPIAAIVGIVATLWHLNPPQQPAPDPRIEIDEQATLTRNASNNQLELHVNLTLLNEGGRVALIPRPRVSLYVESPDEVQNVPADDLHFKFADGTNEVIFPVSLHEGAGSFQRQIVCSIAEGREGAWYRAGLLHINLLFKPEGREAVSRCLVFTPPVTDGSGRLSADESKSITITNDCEDFGERFSKRRS
ncbi:MAG TPA: hypothetical protein VN937_05825 [Blastocatellia bacterium]|nr:hypothetical protein [Blastocatellia bacterium]